MAFVIAYSWALYPIMSCATAQISSAPPGAPAENVWKDDFSGDWTKRWPLKWVGAGEEERTSTFEHGGQTWLRVTYPVGQVGLGFKFRTKHTPRDRVYLEYDFQFSDDLDWVKGGKLPGLYGGDGATGGNSSDGVTGWSVRFMWRADGKGMAYVYHPDQPGKWGQNMRLDNFWFRKGVLQTLGLEVVMNTPGRNDGILRAWLDGTLVVEETAMRFRNVSSLQIDGIAFSTIFGGNTTAWAPTKDEHIDFGGFKLYSAHP